jgi:hypothetical protein
MAIHSNKPVVVAILLQHVAYIFSNFDHITVLPCDQHVSFLALAHVSSLFQTVNIMPNMHTCTCSSEGGIEHTGMFHNNFDAYFVNSDEYATCKMYYSKALQFLY